MTKESGIVATLMKSWGLAIALVAIGVALSFAHPGFLTVPNLLNVARQISINGILAVGVTLVLLTGGVDLSLGSVVALAGVVAAGMAHPGQYPVAVPIALGVAAGALCGATNGLMVTCGRVPSFIATLGMMTAARGLALVVSKGRPVSNLSPEFTRLGGDVGMVPIPAMVLVGIALVTFVVLSKLRLGRYLYAVGGNAEAARASGINVGAIQMFAYTACGALAGVAGVVLAARITTGQPNAGVGYELDAIAAVVIGGTSLSGGVGTVGGTILGALLVGVINNGLDLMNVSSYYQAIVKGVIIVGAVWLDRNRGKS
ncbi:MAG: ABC transporter permease [Akkermansiaceae bacterium]|nr:ABC transporter permease [Akkermansiaceae bacterium]MCF7730815.1 ABC transporter permease [Akkermansiaceae bacterium]